jgi:hypothetical protein
MALPVTLLLHKPAGYTVRNPQGPRGHTRGKVGNAYDLLVPENLADVDTPAPILVLQKHFKNLECLLPIPVPASGLMVFTQDHRVARKLQEEALYLEQECIVEVRGTIDEGGLERLCDGTSIDGKRLPPHQGQLAERNPSALCAQRHLSRRDCRDVRMRGPGSDRHEAPAHRPHLGGQAARGTVALRHALGAVLTPLRRGVPPGEAPARTTGVPPACGGGRTAARPWRSAVNRPPARPAPRPAIWQILSAPPPPARANA